jgi:mannose-6-phosphate isomerase-like protein (cupin superfamily)
MNYVAMEKESEIVNFPGAMSWQLFTHETSPIPGFYAMINEFTNEEYLTPGIHADHEGFYVVEGAGNIRIGDVEYQLEAGTAMIVPAGTKHAIKRNGKGTLKIFLYHFPLS